MAASRRCSNCATPPRACRTLAAYPGNCATLIYLEDNNVDAVAYLDLRVGYEFDLAGTEMQVFGNITNLTDVDPPITPSHSAFNGYSTQYNPAVYDVLGRRFTVGVKLRM